MNTEKRKGTIDRSRSRRRAVAEVALGTTLALARSAAAAPEPSAADPASSAPVQVQSEPPNDEARTRWQSRYADARKRLMEGQFSAAELAFLDLAEYAPTDSDRTLAIEMARLSAAWSERAAIAITGKEREEIDSDRRTRDEITLLYTNAFIYGAGSGAWFLLQVQPSTALSATLPFIGITAAPVIALAVVDGHRPLSRGIPHAIAAGAYLGLGEATLLVGYQHARAHRVDAGRTELSRWKAEDVATVLWTGATAGALMAGTAASSLKTTPGRASFTASAAIWSGALSGLTTGALLPDTAHRTENSMLAALGGYNAGLAAGLLTARSVSPTVARVRLIDLSGVAGGLATGGLYLALGSRNTDERIFVGATSLGAAAGLVGGWIATSGMAPDAPTSENAASPTLHPTITPALGGGMVGVAGVL